MKKTLISLIILILIILTSFVFYLSFYGYKTDKFNTIIKTEVKKNKKNLNLNFDKILLLLDIKKLTLFIKFINPQVEYKSIKIPLEILRANIDLAPLIKNEISIKNLNLETEYLNYKLYENKIRNLNINKTYKNYLNNIEDSKIKLRANLSFDNNYKIKNNFIIEGNVKKSIYKIDTKNKLSNIKFIFSYKNGKLYIENLSFNYKNIRTENGLIEIVNKKKDTELKIDTKIFFQKKIEKLPIIKKTFLEGDVFSLKSNLTLKKNKNFIIKNLIFSDSNNLFKIDFLSFNKKFEINNFNGIEIKTKENDKLNNNFIINNKSSIIIDGKIFDATLLLSELNTNESERNFLKKISKNVEIDFKKVLTSSDLPLNNFRMVGLIKKGRLEKISAKSEFNDDKFLDISIKKENDTGNSILEIYSDEAKPLVNSYEFFEGLEGGNLIFFSNSNKNKSTGTLEIKKFKLNKAPGFAKLLSLADLKGLTDALKGDGISFDKLTIKYENKNGWMDINEIFLIGPSISILVEGYFDKRKDILSLRGTLVPAKTLNNLVSKIPVIGDILIGKKTGEGLFGVSFKIKGTTNNLKTSVNPVKTLTPRFITRALEELKKSSK